MKKLCFILVSFALGFNLKAQQIQNVLNLEPDSAFQNIKIQKISGDKNSTAFIIWIRELVRSHKHLTHSETLYVLAGEGEFFMDGKKTKISKGDFLFIPSGIIHSLKVTSSFPMKVLSVQAPEFLGDDRIFVEE